MRQVAHLAIRECLINPGWRDQAIASVIFARNRPDGRVAASFFLADVGCLGIKSAFGNPDLTTTQYEQGVARLNPNGVVSCDPAFAVKLVVGAYDYARSLGFKPDPDYFYAREIFGSISPADCESGEEIEYGRDGKPFYVAGPKDDVERIINHLTRTVGEDGFHFIVPMV